ASKLLLPHTKESVQKRSHFLGALDVLLDSFLFGNPPRRLSDALHRPNIAEPVSAFEQRQDGQHDRDNRLPAICDPLHELSSPFRFLPSQSAPRQMPTRARWQPCLASPDGPVRDEHPTTLL